MVTMGDCLDGDGVVLGDTRSVAHGATVGAPPLALCAEAARHTANRMSAGAGAVMRPAAARSLQDRAGVPGKGPTRSGPALERGAAPDRRQASLAPEWSQCQPSFAGVCAFAPDAAGRVDVSLMLLLAP